MFCILTSEWIQCGAIITSIFSKIFTKDTHSLPVRVRYGVSFVDPAYDWYSAWVPGIICAISYYIEPRYSGTLLYVGKYSLTLVRLDSSSCQSRSNFPWQVYDKTALFWRLLSVQIHTFHCFALFHWELLLGKLIFPSIYFQEFSLLLRVLL